METEDVDKKPSGPVVLACFGLGSLPLPGRWGSHDHLPMPCHPTGGARPSARVTGYTADAGFHAGYLWRDAGLPPPCLAEGLLCAHGS